MELDELNVKHFIIFRGGWDVIEKILDYKGGRQGKEIMKQRVLVVFAQVAK